MSLNIPVYRAKKIDSDEYITGFLVPLNIGFHRTSRRYQIVPSLNVMDTFTNRTEFESEYKIDLSTLSINFPDMLDSENNPIFASLSEDGKGGDNYLYTMDDADTESYTFYFDKKLNSVCIMYISSKEFAEYLSEINEDEDFKRYKAIGIQI